MTSEIQRMSRSEIGAAVPRAIRHIESPVVRTAGVPLMLLADRVRETGFKVVLTGEGADEVFGGYDIFKEGKIRRFWARQPQSSWRPLLLRRLYGYLATRRWRAAPSRRVLRSVPDDPDDPFAHRP
jgi:asparagine synthase (glutamine-hydrolysing)